MSYSTQEHLYKPLPEASIRVLKLEGTDLAGQDGDKVRDFARVCSLHTISLNTTSKAKPPTKYTALSYVWGSTKYRRPVICDGETLLVTPNLHDVLWKILSSPHAEDFLWVDALCINQQDNDEKGTQVGLMGQIYSMASDVLVWLGSTAAVAGGPFERFWEIVQKENYLAFEDDREALHAGLDFLSSSDWFKRVWTLQEIVLGSNARVWCGSFAVSWEQLHRVPGMSGKGYRDEISAIGEIRDKYVRHGRKKKTAQSRMSDVVSNSAARKATQLHDRIFGLHGMYRGKWPITATYKDSATKVLAQATVAMMQEQGNLKFLNLLKLRRVFLKTTGNPKRLKSDSSFNINIMRPRTRALSWVPTWTGHSRKELDMITDTLDFGGKQNESDLLNRFAGTSKMQVALHGTTLSAKGVLIGRIDPIQPVAVGEHYWQGRFDFSPLPVCIRDRLRTELLQSDQQDLHSWEIYVACEEHDHGKCTCRQDNIDASSKTTDQGAVPRMAWVCLLYGAPDLVVLGAHFDKSSHNVTFTLLLMTARQNTDAMARIFLSDRMKKTNSKCTKQKGQQTLLPVPTSFDIAGELTGELASAYWEAGPDRLPNWREIGDICELHTEKYADLAGASKFQLVEMQDWVSYKNSKGSAVSKEDGSPEILNVTAEDANYGDEESSEASAV